MPNLKLLSILLVCLPLKGAVAEDLEATLQEARFNVRSLTVAESSYRRELKISDEQLRQLRQLVEEYDKKSDDIFSRLGQLSSKTRRNFPLKYQQRVQDRAAAFSELDRDYWRKLETVISKDQIERYQQLQGWGKVLANGRFALFYDKSFRGVLKLPTDEADDLMEQAWDVEQEFRADCEEKIEELQKKILGLLSDAQREELDQMGRHQYFWRGNNSLIVFRKYPEKWNRDIVDDSFHATVPFLIHTFRSNIPQLELNEDVIRQLDQIRLDVSQAKSAEIQKESGKGKLSASVQYKIEREAAEKYLLLLESLLTENQLAIHQVLQFRFRSAHLGPFRQYGDPWLLARMKVSSTKEKAIIEMIEQCEKEYHEFLVDKTQSGWRKLTKKLPEETRARLMDALGEMPPFKVGHFDS